MEPSTPRNEGIRERDGESRGRKNFQVESKFYDLLLLVGGSNRHVQIFERGSKSMNNIILGKARIQWFCAFMEEVVALPHSYSSEISSPALPLGKF